MASSEPSKSSPPSAGPAADCPPGSTASCPLKPKPTPPKKCTLTSETFATSPANRARTKVGVGEEVTITVAPAAAASWTVAGGGKVSPASGTKTTFTAGPTAGTSTVTATCPDGCACTITFTVVEPTNWTMKRAPGTNLRHTQTKPDCGWQAAVRVHPNDVNFYRVEIREQDSSAVASGCFAEFIGIKHGNYPAPDFASGFFGITMTNHTDADGSLANLVDNIYSGISALTAAESAPPFTDGSMSFPINWQWRVGTSAPKNFPTVQQTHVVTADGKCVSSKGGNSEQNLFSDPTSTP